MIDSSHMEKMSKVLSQSMGDAFEVRLYCTPERGDLEAMIALRFSMGSRLEVKTPVEVYKTIEEALMKAPQIKGMADDYELKIKALHAAIEELQKENSRLQRYETHYDLEMDLRHGTGGMRA